MNCEPHTSAVIALVALTEGPELLDATEIYQIRQSLLSEQLAHSHLDWHIRHRQTKLTIAGLIV